MKRKHQILLSLGIILISALAVIWTGGYYRSPETCVEDSLRGLYFMPAEKIEEVRIGSQVYYLYANDRHQYAIHGARKTALFFYRTTGGITHIEFGQSGDDFEINSLFQAQQRVFVVYRNRPDIHKIEINQGDMPVIVLDQWHDDFAMSVQVIENDRDLSSQGTCRAWDQNGKLIEERLLP